MNKVKLLHHVIVKPLRQLESTVQLAVNGVISRYVGGPFCFIADHIGACLYSGVRGPAASYPSRFCSCQPLAHPVSRYSLIERTLLSNVTGQLPARNVGEALAAYASAREQLKAPGNKAKVEDMLRGLGLRAEQVSFLPLPCRV